MRYISKDSLENFEFHDSCVKSGSFDNGTLTFIMNCLNIHKNLPENPGNFDMEIAEAKVTMEDFSLIEFTPGVTWKTDENGNSYPTEPIIEYKGEEGMKRFEREMSEGFNTYHWIINEDENRIIYNVGGCGYEPYFEVSFSASSVTIEWEAYSKKAWYELHKQYTMPIALVIEDEEIQSEIRLVFNDEDENNPSRSVGLKNDDKWIWGQGGAVPDAIVNLEEILPSNIKLKCCQTCRYGNYCPSGNDEEHIFCLHDVSVTNKTDVYHYIVETGELETRKRKWYACCEKYQPMQANYYTYNDYYDLMFSNN